MLLNKKEIDSIDCTPSKRIYRSIIADYDLNTAICELVDNAIDAAGLNANDKQQLNISVTVELDQQSILIQDNAGGVKESELRKLISPGESSIGDEEASIGIFGVGSKRAVVALAQFVQITTRCHTQHTHRLEYDDEWLKNADWHLPYHRVDNIDPSTTRIKLSNLRFRIEPTDVDSLRRHLSMTYAHFLSRQTLVIAVNEELIGAKVFTQWSYPPQYPPQSFFKWLPRGKGKKSIRFQITGGLTIEGGSIGGDYGVFFYCNKRLIARAVRVPEVGFISGKAGVPHPRMSLARIIVEWDGPSSEMPWLSNKGGINYYHPTFKAVQSDVINMVKAYTGLSKTLQPDFDSEIRPFSTGTVVTEKLPDDAPLKPSNLPKLPPPTINYRDSVVGLNKKLADEKPWVRGLYEGLVAFDVLAKQRRLEQRNRLLLIVLDSTLEIAFKEYLANEMSNPFGDDKLYQLFKDRTQVHHEVAKHVFTDDPIWKKVAYYYRLRCELIHKRANVSISDESIEDYRRVVIKLLHKGFKIRFPQSD